MKKYRLRCFICQQQFQSKLEVYRDFDNHPICKDCIRNTDFFDVSDSDWVIDTVTECYNQNLSKMLNDILYVRCPLCHCDVLYPQSVTYTNQKPICESGSDFSCPDCGCFGYIETDGKVKRFAKDEDEFCIKYSLVK